MATSRSITVIFAVAGFLCVVCTIEAVDTGRIRLTCSGDLFKSQFAHAQLSEAIYEILTHTSNPVSGNNCYIHQECDGSSGTCDRFNDIYLHGKCTATLSVEDCNSCMTVANNELFHECTHSMGGQIQLKDCRLRYETYLFRDDE